MTLCGLYYSCISYWYSPFFILFEKMAKRLIPTFNRILVEKIVAPSKTNAGILLPESSNKVPRNPYFASCCCCWAELSLRTDWFQKDNHDSFIPLFYCISNSGCAIFELGNDGLFVIDLWNVAKFRKSDCCWAWNSDEWWEDDSCRVQGRGYCTLAWIWWHWVQASG